MIFKTKEQAEEQQKNLMILTQNSIINDNELHKFSPDADMTDFLTACQNFKEVCRQIGEFIGDQNFKGGFEEAIAFVTGQAFQTNITTGTMLFALWLGCDKACTYEAKKIGIRTT